MNRDLKKRKKVVLSRSVCSIHCVIDGPAQYTTTASLMAHRQTKLSHKKEVIADLASRVLEDPETNVCTCKHCV